MGARAFLATLLTATSVLALSACGGGGDNAANQDSALRVAVNPVPHAKILKYVADELAKPKGLKIEVKEFDDYVIPNTALVDKQVEANYFQTVPFLEKFQKDKGTKLSWIAPVHVEPLSVFSKKVKDLSALPEGAKVAVSNDPANQTRGLQLLASKSLIKLKDGATNASIQDIADNPKKLKFLELEPAQLPRSLDDTDASVVNGNYVLSAKLDSKDAVLVENLQNSPYANGLVTRPELAEDKRIKELAELLKSQQVKDFIKREFGVAVIPV